MSKGIILQYLQGKLFLGVSPLPTLTGIAAIEVDSIVEAVAGEGVTVGGVLLKNGAVTTTGINTESVEFLEAHAGGGQANATQITKRFAIITDVATEGDSVILPVGVVGQTILLLNVDVNKAYVYPATGESINYAEADVPMELNNSTPVELFYVGEGSYGIWVIKIGSQVVRKSNDVSEVTIEKLITRANILSMNGSERILVDTLSGESLDFVSAVLIYDYDTATYGGGGDITIRYEGGAAVSTTISAADSFGASGDKVFTFNKLNAAGGYTIPVNTSLVITNASGAFTDPGTAAGVARLHFTYRIHYTEL